jgi:membrane protein DedA with SNARE-associated domain
MEPSAVQAALDQYGYWALFAGTFLEGETFFLLGGIAARQGLMNPWWVAGAALLGGFVGDQFFFLLGRWRGPWLLSRSWTMARRTVRARRLVRRHALGLMLASRFLYGFRMVIPVACGTSRVHWLTFLILNFTSAVAWTTVFGGLGYLAGGWVSANMGVMSLIPKLLALVLGVVAASAVAGWLLRRKLLAR